MKTIQGIQHSGKGGTVHHAVTVGAGVHNVAEKVARMCKNDGSRKEVSSHGHIREPEALR
ncbi:hypothetical protein ANO14919_137010 [Xylariales sp. No.14919]|nr:hypothetical protein ANO14919_137010 [Xylariales sp. No.14919]